MRLFAGRLREARRAHGLSQGELADRAGISVQYVGKLERGEAAPGIDMVEKLARALGAGLAELVPLEPGEPDERLRERVRERFEQIMRLADRPGLMMLGPLLTMLY